MIVQVQNATKH